MYHFSDCFFGIERRKQKAINGIFFFAGEASFAMGRDVFFANRADLARPKREMFQAIVANPNVGLVADKARDRKQGVQYKIPNVI
ncbi:MAG: hypothetical protein C0412_12385 [Flavobacterium sp.]|nr:hypothetical protein [Flavobacterium sp.]